MAILTAEEGLQKRQELIELGYCVVPNVLRGELLEELRQFTNNTLDTHTVAHALRFQGSDIHVTTERHYKSAKKDTGKEPDFEWTPLVDRLIDMPEALEACEMVGVEGKTSHESILILNKPGPGPALYWHQDHMEWNHPKSVAPWPSKIFLSYYLVDTNRENGCLRAIPGSHTKRIDLHDILPAAHGQEIQALDETHDVFMDHPDAVDLPVKAGDLAILDSRLLHAAWPNKTNVRRPLVLQWHEVFPFPSVPSWWDGPIPPEYENPDLTTEYESTRMPGEFLR